MRVRFIKNVFDENDTEYVGLEFELRKLDKPVICEGHTALYYSIDASDGMDIFIYEGEYEIIE